MIKSEHQEGSDAWYDDLEAWMRSEGIPVINEESIEVQRHKVMAETGRFIGTDLRFLRSWPEDEAQAVRDGMVSSVEVLNQGTTATDGD